MDDRGIKMSEYTVGNCSGCLRVGKLHRLEKWSGDRLTWWAPPNSQELVPVNAIAAARWETICGVEIRHVAGANAADVVVTLGKIDKAGKVLAYAYFPSAARTRSPDIVFDMADWGDMDRDGRLEVATHEWGHILGIEHIDSKEALMNPFYAGPNRGRLYAADIAEAHRRYGAPAWWGEAHEVED